MATIDDIDTLARAITGADTVRIETVPCGRSASGKRQMWRTELKLERMGDPVPWSNAGHASATPGEAEEALRENLRAVANRLLQDVTDALRLTARSG